MHTEIRSNLKAEIVRQYRTQAEFCKFCKQSDFNLSEWRLSRIIKGLADPTDEEKVRIGRMLKMTDSSLWKLVA